MSKKLTHNTFLRLVNSTEMSFNDLKGQIQLSPVSKHSCFKTYLKEKYEHFLQRYDIYEQLDVLPENLSEEMLSSAKLQIEKLFWQIDSDLQLSINDNQSQDMKPDVSTTLISNSVLPRLKLINFNGSFDQWSAFFSKFKSVVDSNNSLTPLTKLQYLLSLLDPEPLRVVSHLPLTDENYAKALKLLQDRYFNLKREITHHCSELLHLPIVEAKSVTSMRQFIDKYKVHSTALQSIPNVDIFQSFLTTFLLSKIDKNLATRFETQTSNTQTCPTVESVLTFLETQALMGENVQTLVSITTSKEAPKTSSKSHSHTALTVNTSPCPFCKEEWHSPFRCTVLTNKSTQDRNALVKSLHLCFNCLKAHSGDCKSKFKCNHCHSKHHTLLHGYHRPRSTSKPPANFQVIPNSNSNDHSTSQTLAKPFNSQQCLNSQANQDVTPATTLITEPSAQTTVLLATAIVSLQTATTQHVVRAVLDTASHISFITERCAQHLKCKRSQSPVPISGIGQIPTKSNGVCFLELANLSNSFISTSHPFFILQTITNDLPRCLVSNKVRDALVHLTLADPTFDQPSSIDLLLGADICASLITGSPYKLSANLPYVLETVFGSVIIGPAPSSSTLSCHVVDNASALCALNVTADNNLSQQLQNFWLLEQPPQPKQLSSPDDDYCENFYTNTTTRDELGRYQVQLPFKPNESKELGDSFNFARRCFLSLELRFQNQIEFKTKYIDFMKDYLSSGHMRLLTSNHNPKYFIPHHGVFKTHGDTSKLRVVFNASAKTTSGYSLNDLLCIGSKLQPLITDVICRFRQHKFVFTCDIRQMYRQICIHPDDQLYQCILWRESPHDPLEIYALTTVTYGVASAPFLALRTLKQLVTDEGQAFPLASSILQYNVFVDDIIAGTDTIAQALLLQKELISLLASGGFELRKWSTNSSNILSYIPVEHYDSALFEPSSNTSYISILGLSWNPQEDYFSASLPKSQLHSSSSLTKRQLLSLIAQIYDPCGWLAPLVMTAKLLMQQLWLLQLDWDDPIPTNLFNSYAAILQHFTSSFKLIIPRRISISFATYQVHGFCDASQNGYAAVIYLRSETPTEILSSIVLCKTRIAPLKTISLPRLELLGAYLLAQLIRYCLPILKTTFPINSVHLWCDSTIVHAWIQTLPYKLKTFVANRVSFIQEHTNPSWWRFVPSEHNAADLPSRGSLLLDSISQWSWVHGPHWLSRSSSDWPNNRTSSTYKTKLPELKSTSLIINPARQSLDLFHHISSWPRAIRIVAKIFSVFLRKSNLSAFRMYYFAEQAICKYIQSTTLSAEIKALKSNKSCSRSIQQLAPFLDNDIVRVGGRLKNSFLLNSQKHPILLPKSHHLVIALVDYYHILYAHCGPSLLQTLLSQRFWIISARSLCRSRTHNCIRCFRAKPTNVTPLMGNLPQTRVNPSPPFHNTGMDFAGPIYVKITTRRKPIHYKFYLCIFICFATKALHLEVVEDLSTSAFISTLQRFISRRGAPAHLYSDCGTNFTGASQECRNILRKLLKKNASQDALTSFSTPLGIQFHFLPPASPQQGGLWESAVKSTKYHLKRVLGSHVPTLLQLITLITRIEAILNSRPLIATSSDPNDLSCLTPAHFLIGRPLTTFPELNLSLTPDNRLKHYHLMQALTQRFWINWRKQYLPTLQPRRKWTKNTPNLSIGDLVLIFEPHAPPLQWPLGRVIKLHPGTDDVVRVARVKTTKGEYTRPVTKLYRLPSVNDC